MDEATRDKCLRFLSHGEGAAQKTTSGAGAMGSEEEARDLSQGTVAVSGLDDEQALCVISHSKEDVPGCVRDWMCLPEPGEGRGPRWGSLEGPLELRPEEWDKIWGFDDAVVEEAEEIARGMWVGSCMSAAADDNRFRYRERSQQSVTSLANRSGREAAHPRTFPPAVSSVA
ncbi:hypothetical protein LTR28_012588 [Elasticomyces elasticus]|nr:hypothetical protein LTR28_012588 [Elasticomyces elasticus]